MKQIHSVLVSLFFISASGAAFAQRSGGGSLDTIPVNDARAADSLAVPTVLSYSFAELGYDQIKFEDSDIKADGISIGGSFLLPVTLIPSVFVTAGYTVLETDTLSSGGSTGTVEISELHVGAGYRLGLSNTLDLKAEAELLQAELNGKGGFSGSDQETGFRLGFGTRFQIAPRFEAGGGFRYEDIGEDSETILEANGLFHIARGFSAYAKATSSNDVTGFGVGGRYNFNF